LAIVWCAEKQNFATRSVALKTFNTQARGRQTQLPFPVLAVHSPHEFHGIFRISST
jgi:hypothetical protein